MPSFTNDSLAEGIVFVGATGASGAQAYQASNGDIVLATGGATGAGKAVVTLPNIVTLFPAVAVQPLTGPFTALTAGGASGAGGTGAVVSGYAEGAEINPPVSPDADNLCVVVRLVAQGASGTGVQVVSADGSLVDGVAGATGVSTTTLQAGWKFVSKSGNWYTV